jgi:imidazolonepropionase-like amidohydrolase
VRALIPFALLLAWGMPAKAQTFAIEGGTVHTMTGAALEGATVLIRDGRIAAVGLDVVVPGDAQRIDARGRIVTPGLFESGTNLGLTEVGDVVETLDAQLGRENRISAAFNVLDGINPNSMLIPITRVAGITTAVSRPLGGLISGQAVVLDLAGSTVEDMVIRSPVAMFASLAHSAREAGMGARGGITLRLREVLEEARAFGRDPAAYRGFGAAPEFAATRLDLVALQPVLRGEIPLVVEAHRASDIATALRIADEYGLRIILYGATEGWMVADRLAAADVPVIVKVLQNLPVNFQSLGARYENAALLRASGVRVAITTGDSYQAFNLRQEAGNAVAYGPLHEDALRAITIDAARIWGLEDSYGSIEPGKVANVVVWDGDPLEMLTAVEHLFIRGRPIPLVTREQQLRDRYLRLDPEGRVSPAAAP